jgi:hypothetical protein
LNPRPLHALDLARRMGMKANMAYTLTGLALASRGGADPGWWARLHGAADQALADLGESVAPLEARLAGPDRQRRLRGRIRRGPHPRLGAGGGCGRAQGITPGCAGKRTGCCRIRCSRDGPNASRARRAQARPRRAGTEQPRHRPAAFLSEHTMRQHLANIRASSASPSVRRPRPGPCVPGWCERGPIRSSAAAASIWPVRAKRYRRAAGYHWS